MKNYEDCGFCKAKECAYRDLRRDENEIKALKNRVNKIIGQLDGIKRQLDEDRHCHDILPQISAISHAVKSLACAILEQNLSTCVAEQIKSGNASAFKEVAEFIRRF